MKIKRGAMLRITMELTETEWDAIYPWDSVKAEAQSGAVEHELAVTFDVATRTLLLTANTQPMSLATWNWDVRFEKDGESIFLPSDANLSFTVMEGVTE